MAELLRHIGADDTRRLFGIPLIILGGVLSFAAEERQRRVQKSMEAGQGVPPSRLPILLTATLALASVAGVLLTVFD